MITCWHEGKKAKLKVSEGSEIEIVRFNNTIYVDPCGDCLGHYGYKDISMPNLTLL